MSESNAKGDLKLTDLPTEILAMCLPDFDPKTISTMRLVCTKFFHEFNRDIYYKAYLINPEENYNPLPHLQNFQAPSRSVQDIVDDINNEVCGKWEGLLRLEKAHWDNLKSGRIDCFEDVKVKGYGLSKYFEGSDAENGRWLVCVFKRQVKLVNLATKQKLKIHQPAHLAISQVYLEHGVLFIVTKFPDCCCYVFKLMVREGEYAIKPAGTFDVHLFLLEMGQPSVKCLNTEFHIGLWPKVVMVISTAVKRKRTNIFLVLHGETGKITHINRNFLPDLRGHVKFINLVMPSPNIIHTLCSDHTLKSFRLHTHPAGGLGGIECFDVMKITTHAIVLYGFLDFEEASMIQLSRSRLLSQLYSSVVTWEFVGGKLKKPCSFFVDYRARVVGFIGPNIVITADRVDYPTWEEMIPCTERVRAHAIVNGRLGPSLFDFSLPVMVNPKCVIELSLGRGRWQYPWRIVLPISRSSKSYIFRINYF